MQVVMIARAVALSEFSTWLDVQTVKLFSAEEIQQRQQLNFDYSAQHLNGFWQQILRPLKLNLDLKNIFIF